MRVYFFTFIYFSPYQEGNVCIIFSGEGAENERSCGAIFCQNLGATCTQVKRLWIGIYPWISMDIHGKSVDMDMNMDGKFHIHGKPGFPTVGCKCPSDEITGPGSCNSAPKIP